MKKEAEVTILMLVWNALDSVKITLESLYNSDEVFKLLIWNNGSNQDTTNFLNSFCSEHNNAKVIHSTKNIGTWHARYNLAEQADTTFIFTADSDLYFPTKWLTPILNTFKSEDNVGQVGPLKLSRNLIHPYTKENVKSYWHKIESEETQPLNQLQKFIDYKNYDVFVQDLINANPSTTSYIDVPTRSLSTCSMLMKRDLFLDRNINDSKYSEIRWGMEDIDLSWSLANLGLKVLKCPDTYIHHFEHSSLQDNSTNMENKDYERMLEYFLEKWQDALVAWCNRHTPEEVANDEFTLLLNKFTNISIPSKLQLYFSK